MCAFARNKQESALIVFYTGTASTHSASPLWLRWEWIKACCTPWPTFIHLLLVGCLLIGTDHIYMPWWQAMLKQSPCRNGPGLPVQCQICDTAQRITNMISDGDCTWHNILTHLSCKLWYGVEGNTLTSSPSSCLKLAPVQTWRWILAGI